MKKNHLCFLWLFVPYTLLGQTTTGRIIDQYQQPVQEANIVNTRTEQHTHSDEQGTFFMENLAIGDTLQVSFIGYSTEKIRIENLQHPLELTLYEKITQLEEIVIRPKINALQLITAIDIETAPVNSSQEILRKVPGLFIGQHAGGGKAEQLFLRGFDIDHGTDVNITVDGLPVNMVSHAHGQGYSDLHFIIPETVDAIDFGKGPYYQNKGNFATAGYVAFKTKDKLPTSTVKLEGGQFDTYRFLGMLDLVKTKNHNAYIATEFLSSDGFFESSQNFNRMNIFGKYTATLNNRNTLGFVLSTFGSQWDASGQIPQRAVNSGQITRFGAIDDTEGGTSARRNFALNYNNIINDTSTLKSNVYLSEYDFELYSNFTFFLEDPLNGDQIRQKENRTLFGFESEFEKSFIQGSTTGSWQVGIALRNDQSRDNELSRTLNRKETLENIQKGDINETNLSAYFGATLEWKYWTLNPALRVDYFDFQYHDQLASNYAINSQTKAIVSPKLNLLYTPSNDLQLYLKTGKGFHSNDTRVIIGKERTQMLPAAYGTDLGVIWKLTPKMVLNTALWYLYVEDELVYVGDAGIVEPSGKTQRQGIDLSYRYQPLPWLFWNLDANYTHARSMEAAPGTDFIPLAPDLTISSGLNITMKSGIYGNINMRHLGDRPANEDNTIIAQGYTVTDLSIGYQWNQMRLGCHIQNLFNVAWNETQFATESRLRTEPQPVEEIHFTPGTPFFIKGIFQIQL